MRIPNATLALIATALLTVALAQSVKQLSVTLAGKTLKLDSVTVGGKAFVLLEQLRIALLNPVQAPGGANQVAAASGCIGELLFNGAWRLKVQNVARSARARPEPIARLARGGRRLLGQRKPISDHWDCQSQVLRGQNHARLTLNSLMMDLQCATSSCSRRSQPWGCRGGLVMLTCSAGMGKPSF